MSIKDEHKGPVGPLQEDGRRLFVLPADVKGPFTRRRYIVFAILIFVYVSLPFISIGGHPAVHLDIEARKFYLFGGTFNAQDFWLVFFLLSGLGFLLIVLTTLFGRVWCGYACPQTVFLEGVFRRIERWVEGPSQVRKRRNQGPWNQGKVLRKVSKHGLFILVSLFLSHFFLSYFISLPSLLDMVQRSPSEHPEAFGWMAVMSTLLYVNFAWFREQLCMIVCPYGRLQSVLVDNSTVIIGYDEKRGEPRGKKSDPNAGDCIDCGRCQAVCPTGIDIRNGLQLECVGCAACIDACDEIMEKVGRPKGLVRYDSTTGFEGKKSRFLRPRVYLYVVLGLVGLSVATLMFSRREIFEARLIRSVQTPFVIADGKIRNVYQVRLLNKQPNSDTFELVPVETEGVEFVIPTRKIVLESLGSRTLPVVISIPEKQWQGDTKVELEVRSSRLKKAKTLQAPFLGPHP